MKIAQRFLLLLLAFSLLLSCIACEFDLSTEEPAEEEQKEEEGTSKTDESEDKQEDLKPVSKKLDLFSSDYKAQFRFVVSSRCGTSATKELTKLIARLRELGAEVDDYISDSDESAVTDCEILIGCGIQNRGSELCADASEYALNDYSITIVGDRVLIAGGSDSALIVALEDFAISGFGVDDDSEEIGKTSLKRTFSLSYKQIDSMKVGTRDLSDYSIVYDDSDAENKVLLATVATKVKTAFASIAGISMNIVPSSSAEKPEHVFRIVLGGGGATGFVVRTSGDELHMECKYANTFLRSAQEFIDEDLQSFSGEIVFDSSSSYTKDANILYYSEFGANGYGMVDDFEAICKTHEEANKTGQKVVADGEKYYIGVTNKQCVVRTDVDWGEANFIIDDSSVDDAHRNYWIFSVESDYEPRTYTASELEGITLHKNDTKINMTFESNVMLIPVYTGHKVYIRYGINENDGSNCTETLLADKDGNIDESTAVLWDYERIDSLTAYRVDDTPITISGGIFTTYANRHERLYNYYSRGICISRSNTVIQNVNHYIRQEGENGAPYTAFIFATKTNNVLIKNCIFSGHKTYQLSTNEQNSMGTYDTESNNANAITWEGCTQNNSITDNTYWGVHASNFCKNLTMKKCTLSRFDAHQGMFNATVIDTTLGQYLNCIGGGLLYCENVTRVCGNDFISLRGDYGSTWEGDVVIKNCTHQGYAASNTVKPQGKTGYVRLFSMNWYDWDFGYTCYMPQNVTIDGFTCDGTLTVFWFNSVDGTDTINKYQRVKSVSYRNITCSGQWQLTNNTWAIPDGTVKKTELSKVSG